MMVMAILICLLAAEACLTIMASIRNSYIYQNDGKGNFTDVTEQLNPDIVNIGMVTGAIWTDVNGDNKNELIIIGEWMTPGFFHIAMGR